MILMGQVRPEVRAMIAAPGIYLCRDTAKPEYTVPLSVHDGKIFSMVEDNPLDPERFLATAEFHGPYFGDPSEGEHGRLTREVAALRRFIEALPCPDPRCSGGSIINTGPDPQNDACEWCYGRHMLLNEPRSDGPEA